MNWYKKAQSMTKEDLEKYDRPSANINTLINKKWASQFNIALGVLANGEGSQLSPTTTVA